MPALFAASRNPAFRFEPPVTEITAVRREHRRLTWSIVAALIVVMLTLSARWGLHLYRCHVVDRQARKDGRELSMEPIGPEWIYRLPGSSSHFAQLMLGRPWDVELEFNSTSSSRAETRFVVWCLSGLDTMEHLGLDGDGVTDADVLQLHGLSGLARLSLRGTRVTAAGLVNLADLPKLSRLVLNDSTSIDDRAVDHISRALQLETLTLDGTAVTDAGLVHLGSLTKLRYLSLNGTAVSDVGLLHLRSLKQLNALSLSNTSVTDGGVEALRKSLPDLEVTDD